MIVRKLPKQRILLGALNKLVQSNPGELVVVDPEDEPKIVDTLSRGDIMAAYNRQLRATG
jgi:hypothetical protein